MLMYVYMWIIEDWFYSCNEWKAKSEIVNRNQSISWSASHDIQRRAAGIFRDSYKSGFSGTPKVLLGFTWTTLNRGLVSFTFSISNLVA